MWAKFKAAFPAFFALTILTCGMRSSPEAKESSLQNPGQDLNLLSSADKVGLAEALRLKAELGDIVWPGLASSSIPILLYNDSYEFLVGEENAQSPWQVVEGDDFLGKPYYRRTATNPQSFAVFTGLSWAGSLSTLEQMNQKVPFKLAADFHVVLILHEVFHAYQASKAPGRFAKANSVYDSESRYPFKDKESTAAWSNEGAALAEALKAKDDGEARSVIQKFLRIRDDRRQRAALDPELLAFEKELEWLEGLAKHVEIRFYELAASRSQEPAFSSYKPGLLYWRWDFARLERLLGHESGDLRFYLSGMAQARLLDRLLPGWQKKAMEEMVHLEDLLRAVPGPKSNQILLGH